MTDTIEPLAENSTPGMPNTSENAVGDDLQERRQDIFDEQFQALMNGFGAACEQCNVSIAIAIAKHPDRQEPIVFFRGHITDAATLAAGVLRQIKQQIFEQLDTEPRQYR